MRSWSWGPPCGSIEVLAACTGHIAAVQQIGELLGSTRPVFTASRRTAIELGDGDHWIVPPALKNALPQTLAAVAARTILIVSCCTEAVIGEGRASLEGAGCAGGGVRGHHHDSAVPGAPIQRWIRASSIPGRGPGGQGRRWPRVRRWLGRGGWDEIRQGSQTVASPQASQHVTAGRGISCAACR
jgi:hypothetical protein